MSQNLRADIEWHRTRIAFYEQALEELEATAAPSEASRADGMRTIIGDLKRTLAGLEKVLAERG